MGASLTRRGSASPSSTNASSISSSGEHEPWPPADGVPVHSGDELPPFRFSWRRLWRFLGPGFLMSLAYLDPGNLESNLQAGAYTGLRLTWVLWWATMMGLVMQESAARLALVTGCDLAQLVRARYPRWLNYVVYFNMEAAVIAADFQWCGLDTFTFLAVQQLGVRYLELLICAMIGAMAVCFSLNLGHTGAELLRGWALPGLQSYAVTQAVGTVGAVIMPHNLFLHSGVVLSRRVPRSTPRRVNESIWYTRIESTLALLLSFYINLAVVATNDASFFDPACATQPDGPKACLPASAADTTITSHHCDRPGGGKGVCGELGLLAEGYALEASLGPTSLYVWAIGLLAAGQASTMVCTYAGQIIMGGCLELSLAPWKRVALTRSLALGPALLVAAYTAPNPALFSNINEYLNVQLPFAVLPALTFAASKPLMGPFRTRRALLAVSYAVATVIIAVNIYLVAQSVAHLSSLAALAAFAYSALYVAVCIRMACG
ncbi:hypothetical protein EMIHUDRAFT_245923 [Emiliania huxleyi CCMP1516]|uniref:Uncharacterized protein n=2 Tax=Emiliania huxleyi TaxID=2903 RepID=A0A0D3IVF1_EMIH1|nr:hypothetical protein EMIHUDRAFT_245923 [Emiliania huxleyi CCMP1516]EOD15236.1 hypothetical protein EMIHUDRAFT_245923 [Emiliania huxleyi CCMP1516]|eukprot:XP_005767665.1 hypothetical protein EMIHUDRAFT_245923 [Emiliania huxleyi CCMP1516]